VAAEAAAGVTAVAGMGTVVTAVAAVALGQAQAPQQAGSASAGRRGQAALGRRPELVLAGSGLVARREPAVLPGLARAGPGSAVPRAPVTAVRLAGRAQAGTVALAGRVRVAQAEPLALPGPPGLESASALRLGRGTAPLLRAGLEPAAPQRLVPARQARAETRPLTVSAPRA
jgi:hypothetical protein